ncbi:hypothetical protein V6N12_071511 [Hibiscus sabdariffa]
MGWVKANADGASSFESGVVRYNSSKQLFGFVRNLGLCSSLVVEVWAVHNVLVHAWNHEFRFVELKTCNMDAEGILRGTSNAFPRNTLVDDLRELLIKDWNVIIRRISKK